MPEEPQTIAEAVTALGDAAINYVTKTWPTVTVSDPRPTVGARMQEMEREIADLKQQRDYWHDDAEGLRADNVAAYDAVPAEIKRVSEGLTLADLVSQLAADLTDMTESRDYWQDRRAADIEAAHLAAEFNWTRDNHLRLVTQVNRITGTAHDPATATPMALIGALQRTVEPDHYKDVIAERDRTIADQKLAIERLRADRTQTREELTTLRNTHHEWVNGQHTKQPTLSESIQRMNDVITMQIETMSPTSGTGKVVDIRRRMLAKYSITHDMDRALNGDQLRRAANALLDSNPANWPWDNGSWDTANREPLLHACALFIAHYDAITDAVARNAQ